MVEVDLIFFVKYTYFLLEFATALKYQFTMPIHSRHSQRLVN